MKTGDTQWQQFAARLKVVRLSTAVKLLVPTLLLSTLPKKTRAVSFEGGAAGVTIGLLAIGGSSIIGWLLYPTEGLMGLVAALWLIGSSGVAMIANSVRPLAFVKPICTSCRLLPVIEEHEAIHLSGVESDDEVWNSMKQRYSCKSLSLDGDPKICSFCPIPKRLREPSSDSL